MDIPKENIYSVVELTEYIKSKLSKDETLSDVWVVGEVSNFTAHSSGHFYFSLKDSASQLPCAMFRGANQHLKFRVENGQKMLARGRIDIYIPRGSYNLIVSELHPEGMGSLHLAFIQLKERLEKEGLFSKEHKQPLPKFPERIGVVTSSTGAAFRDIENVLARRYPLARVVLAPTLVQGSGAAADIARSIELLNSQKDIDVLIVGRGGGSIEDLWPFNEEVVARAIFSSRIPVISAVGHETDFTISDFVADMRASTPSAAAELAVPDRTVLARHVEGYLELLATALGSRIAAERERLDRHYSALRPRLILDMLDQKKQRADEFSGRLQLDIRHTLKSRCQDLSALSGRLEAVSPLATLQRGYSYAVKHPDGPLVRSIEGVKPGEILSVVVSDGSLDCSVLGIHPRLEKKTARKTTKDMGKPRKEKSDGQPRGQRGLEDYK